MAARNWVTSICTAIGIAVGAGAAQLGVGYGLSVVAWVPATEDSSRSLWLASLAWVTWLSANSTIIGALCADRLSQRQVDPDQSYVVTLAGRAAIAVAAAIGALITVPLVAIPARVAQQVNNSAPHFTAGGYAVVGVIVGLVLAIGALSLRAVAANVIMSAAWLWLLATTAVVQGLRSGTDAGTAQLATWQFHEARWVRGMVNLPGALLMLGLALIIGFGAAWRSGRAGDHRVGVAVSGATGPLLVATSYFLAVPGTGSHDHQLSAYVTAPYAVIAGLAGSVLVSAIGPKGSRERARQARAERDAEEHAEWQRSLDSEGQPDDSPTANLTGQGSKGAAGDASADPVKPASSGRSWPRRRRGAAKEAPDLEDDAYAPARAYVTDTGDPDRSSAPDDGGTASAASEPIWPEQLKPQSKRRRGR